MCACINRHKTVNEIYKLSSNTKIFAGFTTRVFTHSPNIEKIFSVNFSGCLSTEYSLSQSEIFKKIDYINAKKTCDALR